MSINSEDVERAIYKNENAVGNSIGTGLYMLSTI